jgi:hypothetical protein
MNRQINFTSRREQTKKPRKAFLIVCEGSKTEPHYFESFRLPRDVFDIEGCGANTESVVKVAIRLAKEKSYDEVWCVFDRDSFKKQQVNTAILSAETAGFKVAFSNESFELWYVLHFGYLDVAQNRHQYCSALSKHMGCKYEKNSEQMYEKLLSLQKDAIKNAKRLANTVSNSSWANRIPYTGVYLLVEALNKEMKKYSVK